MLACYNDDNVSPVVKQYLLIDTSDSGVNLGGYLDVTSSSCVIGSSSSPGTIYLNFSINLNSKMAFHHIYAAGPSVDAANYVLHRYSSNGQGSLIDVTETNQMIADSGGEDEKTKK